MIITKRDRKLLDESWAYLSELESSLDHFSTLVDHAYDQGCGELVCEVIKALNKSRDLEDKYIINKINQKYTLEIKPEFEYAGDELIPIIELSIESWTNEDRVG